jgi:hypothetical protein
LRIDLLCLWKLQLLLCWHATSVTFAEISSWENKDERRKAPKHAGLT